MKNHIGLQTSYWNGTTPKLDIFQVIDLTKKAGMDIIELKAGDFVPLTKKERKELRAYIENAGLKITINGTGLRPERDVSNSDPEIHEAGVNHLCYMLDLAEEMGAEYFSGIPYGLWNTRPEGDPIAEVKEIRTQNAVKGLKRVARHAQEVGVILCLEIVNRFEQYIANTAAEGIAICEAIDSDSCKLLLDTFHMNIEEDYIPDAIQETYEKGYLGYIHIGENNRKIPTGEKKSNIDWSAIAHTIQDIGFQGPLVMEPFVLAQSSSARSVSLWRSMKASDDMDGLLSDAAAGVRYLKSL